MSAPELTGPPLAADPAPHLLAPLWRWADDEPDRPLLAAREGDGFTSRTAAEVRAAVRDTAAGLIARGVQPGDRVALLARSRLEWVVADLAILAAGAVSVPIYDTSSAEQIERILDGSGARLALVETAEQRAVVAGSAGDLPELADVLAIDEGALDRLAEEGRDRSAVVDQRVGALQGDQLAALIYSSGTTGEPKGCELTHANLCANARQTAEQVPELFEPGARTLVFLPLAHALARLQVHASLEQGALIGFASDPSRLVEELPLFRPTFLVAVPRVFEKIRASARAKAEAAGRGRVFDRAVAVAVRTSRARREGRRASPLLRLQHALFDRLVYAKVRSAFGGEVRHAISGGSALAADLGRFFDGAGIPVLEGYGLTEASPIVSGGPASPLRFGTVGRPFPATTVRLAADGEVLVRGPQVFRGYRGDAQATAAAFADGWLRTGDLGAMTATGELVITGRKKEIIVTASGKNVAPGPLEDLVRAHPLVDQCVVVGEGRPFIGALLTLDREELARKGRAPLSEESEAALRAELDEAVARANRSVSRAEGIRAYRILDVDLTVESGALTPTLKLRRQVIDRRFAEDIAAIYD